MYESECSRNSSAKDRPKDYSQHIREHFLDTEGQIIGLGSGKTVADFVSQVGNSSSKDSLRFIASSLQIKLQAEQYNLRITDENKVMDVQVLVDGADQVDSEYHMIKGGGGALFREKILFKAARKLVILADIGKYVNNLDRAVPVEVHPFARALFNREIKNFGIRVIECRLRFLEKGFPFFTENGNVIFDVEFESIRSVKTMETDIKSIPGVIEVGLFPRPKNVCYYKIYPDGSYEVIKFGEMR
jgi:ribose 5-phosphate isomerase A